MCYRAESSTAKVSKELSGEMAFESQSYLGWCLLVGWFLLFLSPPSSLPPYTHTTASRSPSLCLWEALNETPEQSGLNFSKHNQLDTISTTPNSYIQLSWSWTEIQLTGLCSLNEV